jgi:hypothetical protein
MSLSGTDDGWNRRLAEPSVQAGLDELLAELLAESVAESVCESVGESAVGAAVRPGPPLPGHRPRRRLPTVALGLGLAVLGAGGAVAAEQSLHAHTGEVVTDPGEIARGGPGEVLDADAADFLPVARQVTADIAFPPGYERHREAILQLEYDPEHAPVAITTGTLRLDVAKTAFCSWVSAWLEDRAGGDGPATRRSVAAIVASPRWPAVAAMDPAPDPRGRVGDNGERSSTLFGWALPVIAAVQADDPVAAVDTLTDGGRGSYCVTFSLPFVPDRQPVEEPAR